MTATLSSLITAYPTFIHTSPLCHIGYEGPLCASCSAGYWFDFASNACRECSVEGSKEIVPLILVPILPLVVAVIIIVQRTATALTPTETAASSSSGQGMPLTARNEIAYADDGDPSRRHLRRRSSLMDLTMGGELTIRRLLKSLWTLMRRRLQKHSLMAKTKILVTCYQVTT